MLDNPKENMVFANRETFITVQIEDPEALEVIDEMLLIEIDEEDEIVYGEMVELEGTLDVVLAINGDADELIAN